MGFSMSDFLSDYRKEDITKEKEIIQSKWRKTLDIIKEAFQDKYTNKTEAIRIVNNEFVTGDCSDKVDVKFLKENLDYVIDKMTQLDEGSIKIIINNTDTKDKKDKDIDVSEIDEAKKNKKGKKKTEKDDEDSDEAKEDEIIIDEPAATTGDDLTVSTAEAPEMPEVYIVYDAKEKKLTVKEGEEVIEELEIEDVETLTQVVAFLKDFYSKHDYIVNEEGLEDIEGSKEHEATETPDEEAAEDLVSDEEVEESFKVAESRTKWGFLNLLEEDFKELGDELREETTIPKASELIGKAVMTSDGKWFTVKETSDNNVLTVMDKDGQETNIDLKDVTDFEKDIIKKEAVEPKEDVVEEAVKPVAKSLISSWLKKKKSNTKKSGPTSSNIDKKKTAPSGNYTKAPMKKTGQVISKVKLPAVQKKGESTGSFTKKSGMKTMSKVPSTNKVVTPKKDAPTGSFSKSPMKVSGKVSSVVVPKSTKKDAPKGNWTAKSNSKPQEKHENVKIPKV